MEIKTVSLIGLGALGVLFGNQMAKNLEEGALRVVADEARADRYRREGVYSNGELCGFSYVSPEEKTEPADLLLFAVKYNDLPAAIEAAAGQVGENTVILSLLNGIASEDDLSRAFGADKVLHCVAQGMDAVKVGNQLTYSKMGMLCFGDPLPGEPSEKALGVARFFERTGLPHLLDRDMPKRMWGKFMLNVGLNQTVAVYESNYGSVQREGEARDTMIAAMREVLALSEKEGVGLTEDDLNYWLGVLVGLDPEAKPSMRQDMEAKRYSEVELFSGTVLALGKKHGVDTPVNRWLYEKITAAEREYGSN